MHQIGRVVNFGQKERGSMPEPGSPRLGVSVKQDLRVRATLLARVQTVQLLKMSEGKIADLIKQVESDPLFERLLYPLRPEWKIVRYKPHPRTRLSSSFYDIDQKPLAGDTPADVSGLLKDSHGVMSLIRKMGREKFEKYFLRAEENVSVPALAAECGVKEAEVHAVRDFLLTYSVRAEIFDPSARNASNGAAPTLGARRITRLARLEVLPDGEVFFEFLSPHLARGRYDIHYDRLQFLTRSPALKPEERRRLKAFVRRLELINWRQNTLYRILDLLCHGQRNYLASRDTLTKAPFTQRQMARKLSVAPSTVNRAIQNRSLLLPWGEELLLEELFHARKDLCVDVLESLAERDPAFERLTDTEVQNRLVEKVGFPIPRRTVNTYRRFLAGGGATGGIPSVPPSPPAPPGK
jgi:hypothetical protein